MASKTPDGSQHFWATQTQHSENRLNRRHGKRRVITQTSRVNRSYDKMDQDLRRHNR
jgi:hypothetical protein